MITLVALDVALFFTHYRGIISRWNYPQHYFTKDAELGFDIVPNFATSTHYFPDAAFPVWSNNIGCFDTDYASETPYIYMAGDSLTWGFVPFEDTWGKRMQDILGVRTMKCGVTGGYGTRQELIRTTRHLSQLPSTELIIVGYTQANDIDDDANFPSTTIHDGYLVPNLAKGGMTEAQAEEKYALFEKYCTLSDPSHPILQKARCLLNNYSVLYNLAKKNIRGVLVSVFSEPALVKLGIVAKMTPAIDAKSETGYQDHLKNVLGFKDLARREGAGLLFVLVPGENDRLKSFMDKQGIAYLDLKPAFEEYSRTQPLNWKIDGHWNIAGNHLAGLLVSRYLLEKDIIRVTDKASALLDIQEELKKSFGSK
jgi:hypothetical protein